MAKKRSRLRANPPEKDAQKRESKASEAAGRIFHALGDPTRRAMLEAMAFGPRSVSALAASFDLTLAAVLQHLQVLETSGLIVTHKEGRVRACQVDLRGLHEATAWIETLRPTLDRQLARLHEMAAEQEAERRAKAMLPQI